jgi:hypothetical protein
MLHNATPVSRSLAVKLRPPGFLQIAERIRNRPGYWIRVSYFTNKLGAQEIICVLLVTIAEGLKP